MRETELAYLQELYEQYASPLVRYIYRHVGDSALAEDLMQETFLTALVKLEDVRRHPAPLSWLFRTAWNLTMREREKQRRMVPSEDLAQLSAPSGAGLTELLPRDIGADDTWLLERYYGDQWSVIDLSRQLGITQSACKMRLLRLRERLKAQLTES